MSPAADAPMVPASATLTAFSDNASRLRTITSALAKERGETNERLVIEGLKMYGLSA